MANLRISQLPQYTGNTTGTWTILNNAAQDATYKVLNSDLMPTVVNAGQGRLVYTDSTGKVLTATSNIVATGTTLVVNATYSQTGSMSVSGATKFTGTHNVNGNTSITGSLNISGSASVTGLTSLYGNLQVSGDTSLTGSLRVSNNATMSGSVKITGSLNHEGRSAFTGSMQITGNVSVTGSISSSLSSNFNRVNVSSGINQSDPNNIFLGTRVFDGFTGVGTGHTNNGNIAIGIDINPLSQDVYDNVIIGNKILSGSAQGASNNGSVLIGQNILRDNSTNARSRESVVVGDEAAQYQGQLVYSIAIGKDAMKGVDVSAGLDEDNVAIGYQSMRDAMAGQQNVGLGNYTLSQNKSGSFNTAIGNEALIRMDSGSSNVAIGYGAGDRLNYPTGSATPTLQSNNFFLSNRLAPSVGTLTYYQYNVSGSLMYGTFDQHPSGSTLRVNGRLAVKDTVTLESSSFTNGIYNTGSLINSGSVDITGSFNISGSIRSVGSMGVTGSVSVTSALRMAKSSPLPAGNSSYGTLAVSGSNLWFHNGSSWNLVV